LIFTCAAFLCQNLLRSDATHYKFPNNHIYSLAKTRFDKQWLSSIVVYTANKIVSLSLKIITSHCTIRQCTSDSKVKKVFPLTHNVLYTDHACKLMPAVTEY